MTGMLVVFFKSIPGNHCPSCYITGARNSIENQVSWGLPLIRLAVFQH